MPFKKRTYNKRKPRKPFAKKSATYTKRRRTTTKRSTHPKKQPFSHYERTNLKYQRNNDLVSAATQNISGTESAYTLNDVNRPFFAQTAADYLPMGHSQYRAVFNKFKVYAAKLDLEINPNMTGKQVTLLVMLNNSQNISNTIQGVSATAQSGLQNTWTYVLPTDKKFKFSKYVSIASLESVTRQQFDSDLYFYHGTPTASAAQIIANTPFRVPTFKFSLINETDNVAVSIPFEMKINYYTAWYDRHRLPQSTTTV